MIWLTAAYIETRECSLQEEVYKNYELSWFRFLLVVRRFNSSQFFAFSTFELTASIQIQYSFAKIY